MVLVSNTMYQLMSNLCCILRDMTFLWRWTSSVVTLFNPRFLWKFCNHLWHSTMLEDHSWPHMLLFKALFRYFFFWNFPHYWGMFVIIHILILIRIFCYYNLFILRLVVMIEIDNGTFWIVSEQSWTWHILLIMDSAQHKLAWQINNLEIWKASLCMVLLLVIWYKAWDNFGSVYKL